MVLNNIIAGSPLICVVVAKKNCKKNLKEASSGALLHSKITNRKLTIFSPVL